MKLFLIAVLSLTLSTINFAQDISREQKFRQIKEFNAQINKLAEELLLPDADDFKNAEAQGLKAFRLMPREVFLAVRLQSRRKVEPVILSRPARTIIKK